MDIFVNYDHEIQLLRQLGKPLIQNEIIMELQIGQKNYSCENRAKEMSRIVVFGTKEKNGDL